MKTEPALILGAIQALIALIVSFGLSLTTEQIGAILAFAAVVVSIITRYLVVSPATLEAKVTEAKLIAEAKK